MVKDLIEVDDKVVYFPLEKNQYFWWSQSFK